MKFSRLFCLLLFFVGISVAAQPPARQRQAAANANAEAQSDASSTRRTNTAPSIREFPTAAHMPTDVVWRRDVYRRLDLTKDANAPLYYPITPTKERDNLFVYLFRLILRNQIKAYEYTRDANEHFDEAHVVKGKKIMDDNSIYYELNDGRLRLNDVDLPSADVKVYFLKESVFYDQYTATFHTKVTALCPVIATDFGDGDPQLKPLFWVNYEEAAPYLAKLSLMGSNLNNAALVSADDYFSTNRYEGEIYKTTNLQDRIINQYATTDSARLEERNRIEGELKAFQSQVWGNQKQPEVAVPADTLAADSTQNALPARTTRRSSARRTAAGKKISTPKSTTVKTPKSSSSSSRTYSVRRQRR